MNKIRGKHKLVETVPIPYAKYIERAIVRLRERGMPDEASIDIHAGWKVKIIAKWIEWEDSK